MNKSGMDKHNCIDKIQMLIQQMMNQQLLLKDIVDENVKEVIDILPKVSKICFCGKLPWTFKMVQKVKQLLSNHEIFYYDVFDIDQDIATRMSDEELAASDDCMYVICSRWHYEDYMNVLHQKEHVIFYAKFLLYFDSIFKNIGGGGRRHIYRQIWLLP